MNLLQDFFLHRNINKDFYKLVSEDQLDFKMTPKSDSVRKTLVHLIDSTRDYINGIKTGKLQFVVGYEDLLRSESLTKQDLLEKLEAGEKELEAIFSDPEIESMTLTAPWSPAPIKVIDALGGLVNHEILHTGWNLAVMDHLNIPRYPSLQTVWGK